MPSIKTTTTVAAGGVNANVLAGSQFEFIRAPSRVQIYIVADTVATAVPEAEIFFGQEIELPQAVVGLVLTAGTGPAVPDDLVVDDVAAPNDRLVVRLLETGGLAAAIIRVLVKITPLPIR